MRAAGTRGWADWSDVALLFIAAILFASCVVFLKRFHPFFVDNASVVVAFFFAAATLAAIRLRGDDAADYGLSWRNAGSELLVVALLCAVVFPVYLVGFKLYWGVSGPFHPRLPIPLWQLAATQLLVVAFPEELLFRGYIQRRLGDAFRSRARLLGFTLGWHIPAASLLFAAGHIATERNPARLATFFPGLLFGLLAARKGSVVGCTLLHAACNIFSNLVIWSYYPA